MLEDLTDELERGCVQLALVHGVGRAREVIARTQDEQPQIEIYPTVTAAIDATACQPGRVG